MKTIKYIVFADKETRCSGETLSFIEVLGNNFKIDNKEYAIGICSSESKEITEFDSKYDIFIFNDSKKKPEANSIFFRFIDQFLRQKDTIGYKIVLHRSSDWDFTKYYRNGIINSDYTSLKDKLDWLKSIPIIKHSHIPNEVYCDELKEIANSVNSKNVTDYQNSLEKLENRFPDSSIEAKITFQKKIIIFREQGKDDEDILNELKNDERIQNAKWDDRTLKNNLKEFVSSQTQVENSAQEIEGKTSLKKLIIWDEETSDLIKDFEQNGDQVIKTKTKWQEKINELRFENFDAVIILAELNWGAPPYLQDFYGIEIAKKLRKSNFRQPILFISSILREDLYNNDKKRYILNTIGHDLNSLDTEQILWNESVLRMINSLRSRNHIPKLNEEELSYIQLLYCENEGLIRKIIHDINNTEFTDNIKEKLIESIQQIYAIYSITPNLAIEQFESSFQTITEQNHPKALTLIEGMGEKLISDYSNSNSTKVINKEDKENWSVLVIDDQIEEENSKLSVFLEKLESKVKEIFRTTNAIDASDILVNDFKNDNSIRVVIADYQLQTKKNGVLIDQEIQGFSFLKKVAKSGRIIGLIGLSGLPRRFLMKTFGIGNINVYYKGDLFKNDDSINILCDEVLKCGEEIEESLYSLPNNTNWEKYYKQKYIEHRNNKEYKKRERRIAASAIHWIDNYENEIENTLIMKGLGKGKISQSFDNFEIACISRRIALWLSVKGKNKDGLPLTIFEIAKLLKETTEYNSKLVISQELALRLSDFPTNLTIEEKNWFHNDMNIPIYKEISILRDFFRKIEDIYKKYISENNEIKEKIHNEKLKVNYTGDVEFIINFDNKKPRLKSYSDLLILTHELIIKPINELIKKTGSLSHDKEKENRSNNNIKKLQSLLAKTRRLLEDGEGKFAYNESKCLSNYFYGVSRILGKINKKLHQQPNDIFDEIAIMLINNKNPEYNSPLLEEYTTALLYVNDPKNNVNLYSIEKDQLRSLLNKNKKTMDSQNYNRQIIEGTGLEKQEKIQAAKAKKQAGSNLTDLEDQFFWDLS